MTQFLKRLQKLNIIDFVKVEFMAKYLYWVALDCASVHNKVAAECPGNRHTNDVITETFYMQFALWIIYMFMLIKNK